MTGHLDLVVAPPDAMVTLLHDSGPAFSAQAVAGAVTLGPFDLPDGNGATLTIGTSAYRGVLWLSLKNPVNGSASFAVDTFPSFKPRRPAPRPQAALPPFDPNDPNAGEVHTTLPPEQVIPAGPDVLFFRADFTGVTLDLARWGTDLPMLKGANSTPLAMLMSPMLLLYPRKWQDAYLTESAERGLTHFIFPAGAWNDAANGRQFSPADVVEWATYLDSWGFYRVYWNAVPTLNDPFLQALVDAHAVDFHVCGEEVDGRMTAEQYEAVLDNNLAISGGGLPTGAHFTANYPEGFPRDTFLINWAKFNGKVHLCWQANPADSAGRQAAMLYYARRRVNLGGVGGNGIAAPDSRVIAFETMAEYELYGKCTEAYGNLRSWQLLCAPIIAGERVRPISGFGNGCRRPDGTAI